MTRVTTQQVRRDLVIYMERCRNGERITITRWGIPVLAMVPVSDLDQLTDLELLLEQMKHGGEANAEGCTEPTEEHEEASEEKTDEE
ncbi:MAG TPA: type II toxin-antitoxin system prevent-host-death family antitoxin [Candidatus Kapabacteria bacterium]|nr:type II toxin-antitoxin system prevent-host-death family antitoxin [Candidatus Kapabacteria bacterium]